MIDHQTRARQFRELAMGTAERAQSETDTGAQSRIYALAEGYLLLAEEELRTAGAGDQGQGEPRAAKR